MDIVLQQLAQKLNEYDEASLMDLWEKYAERVHSFEPSKRWEEAALVLCFIQAVQWKNRLFNYHVLNQSEGAHFSGIIPQPVVPSASTKQEKSTATFAKKKATVLHFPSKE